MKESKQIDQRIGQINKNKYGSLMKVIEYHNAKDILVKFENGKPVHTQWDAFVKGKVRSNYDKSVFNIGFIGDGNYKSSVDSKDTIHYITWYNMMTRCYSKNYHKTRPTYLNCSVADIWHNFQNFSKWFDENYYNIDDEKMCLDKDILIKGNKTYSPKNCLFVPERINNLFIKCNSKRNNLPIGVHWHKRDNIYTASFNNGVSDYIGTYSNPLDAFIAYKSFKENYIKEVAEEYKDKIPYQVYKALINYQVEITD